MPRSPTDYELALLDAAVKRASTAPRAANESSQEYLLRVMRGMISDLRSPPHDVLDAGRAHVAATPSMMTAAWNAMLEKISPEE